MADYRQTISVFIFLCAFRSIFSSLSFKYFSTKTPYEWIHPPDNSDLEDKWFNEQFDLDNDQIDDLTCSAVHTSIVARHGTRNPGLDDVLKINEVHDRLGPEVRKKFEGLQDWQNPFPSNNRKSLVRKGQQELQGFGSRTAQRLFSLFAEEDIDSFRYIVSSQERARDSAHSFYDGFVRVLQEEVDEEEDEYEPEISDKLLRFHDLCEKYIKSVGDNKTALKEFYDFQSGELVNQIKNKIVKKLDVQSDAISESKY